ncbi:hypothetical protein KIW84_034843 [Lathyrus oleraceus]|uniref:Uncharacterized protein n=1 Tax=Pisum sativum TaxID=3888 RepID=A0A9D4Y237_PEA|nr:hypothetical protein KIW84_034843 [Pisum sativum]
MTLASSISKQTVTSHSASLINGIPINEASNLMWQPEVMAANTNWLQRGASAVIQGSANGFFLDKIFKENMFGSVVLGINSGLHMENLQQMNSEQRDVPMEDFHARNSGLNMLDGSDSFSGFPSLQSGSRSALMQSAVAETSSSEVGIQEEWSGLSSRNTESSLPNEGPLPIGSSKQQSVWPDDNLQSVPHINSRPITRQGELSRPNSTVNYYGLPGFHQPGADTAQEQHNRTKVLLDNVPVHKLADILVASFEMSFEEQLSMLDSVDPKLRLSKATELVDRHLQSIRATEKITQKVEGQLSKFSKRVSSMTADEGYKRGTW